MSDALIFGGFFVGLFVLRAIVATVVFFIVIPQSDRCPYCDSATFRMHRPRLGRVLPFVRASWCCECGWEGWLRCGAVSPSPVSPARAGSPTSSR